MNIIVVNDTGHINGGAAKLAIAEAIGLADRGHSVCFLAAVEPIAQALLDHPNIQVTSTNQFDLLADPIPLRAFVQGWWNAKAHRAARAVASGFDPQDTVVHLHIWSRSLSASVARAFLDAGFRIVCTLHDFVLACPTGTFFLHSRETVCRLKPMSTACMTTNCDTRSYPQKLWRVGRQAIQNGLGHVPSLINDYIVHSKLALDIMEPFLPVNAACHQVTAYIDADRRICASPANNKSFVYLGRLVREKGVIMLAKSAAAENLPVTFVGSGALKEEIRSANPDAVITGWTDSNISAEYVRKARALVFPSLWHETLGLVVLEAASQGIPSIVSDTCAAREIVEDGVTGLHFHGGDEGDLRAKMRLLDDSAFVARLGKIAYERFWSSQFSSLEKHILQLETIYSRMLNRIPIRLEPTLFATGAL